MRINLKEATFKSGILKTMVILTAISCQITAKVYKLKYKGKVVVSTVSEGEMLATTQDMKTLETKPIDNS